MYLKSISTSLYVESLSSDHLYLQTDICAMLVTYAIFGFWVPTNTTHAITPWFRGIAQQQRDHSKAHCYDTHFYRSNTYGCFLFNKFGKYSSSKYHFGAPGSEDNISRCRQSIHTGIDSACTWSLYLPCCTWKVLIQIILTSIRTAKNTVFFARFYWVRPFIIGLESESEFFIVFTL
jgi:hypothetical protein